MNYRYIDNISNKSREATMRLYGSIGDKIDGDMFAQELASLDRLDLDLVKIHANTPGGNVFQGMSIVSAIMSMDTPVHVYVDGVVASMGAVITVAADRVVMMDFSQLMIHDPYFIDTLPIDISPKQKKMLSRVREMLEQVLMRRGKNREEIATLMKEETWFSAEEAKANGFCDEIIVSTKKDLLALAPMQIVAAINEEYNLKTKKQMEKNTLTAEALVALGITDSADPAAVSAAVVQLKKDHKNATDELIEMKAAEKERAKKAAEELVASAIREGRITADKRTEWLEFAAEKPDMAKASLEAIPAKVSLSKQISAIQTDGTIPADRASWKHIDWLKNDPEGLAKIKAEQPDIFEAIRKVR